MKILKCSVYRCIIYIAIVYIRFFTYKVRKYEIIHEKHHIKIVGLTSGFELNESTRTIDANSAIGVNEIEAL